jgi:hypothetical protein
MRFGVVACPQCRRVQAIETRHRRVHCRGCGRRFPLEGRRLLAQADDERKVQPLVAALAARQAGMPIESMAEALSASEPKAKASVSDVLVDLAGLDGGFTKADFVAAAQSLGVEGDPERLFAVLVRDSLVFEPRPGVFRVL